MTRDEIITLVLNRLGNRANDTALTAAAKLELNLALETAENDFELPWFLESEWTSATLEVTGRIALPSNFLMELEDSHLYITGADGKEKSLGKDDFDALKEAYAEVAAGQPKKYALLGNYYFFFPTPDQEYSIRMQYYRRETALSDEVLSNGWTLNAPDFCIGALGEVLAGQYVKDYKTKESFMEQKAAARVKMLNKTVARREANTPRSMGD